MVEPKSTFPNLSRYRISILGYGNQGRAQALNLRDSGLAVTVASRPGRSWEQAEEDGFHPVRFDQAVAQSEVLLFLFPDHAIPALYRELSPALKGKMIGFAHGLAFHYRWIEPCSDCEYFLVGPKGAGAILRDRFLSGDGLPGIYALADQKSETLRNIAIEYARGIGCFHYLKETTFQEETECDLFGEQAVLCGGIQELMRNAYEILVENGHTPEMAFFECCFEAKLILELFLKYGPAGMSGKISPTAFFGGVTRGKRLITPGVRTEMEKVFREIRDGRFADEWKKEVAAGFPTVEKARTEIGASSMQKTYDILKDVF